MKEGTEEKKVELKNHLKARRELRQFDLLVHLLRVYFMHHEPLLQCNKLAPVAVKLWSMMFVCSVVIVVPAGWSTGFSASRGAAFDVATSVESFFFFFVE